MSATFDDVEQLLKKVAEMQRESLENARLTGTGFNIFSILGLEHYETSTHSAFLVELLNPKGSHGQEDRFLKLFIEQLNLDEFNDFNTSTAEVRKEVSIGWIDAEYREGGKMDILIAGDSTEGNGRKAIGIENKIYARDQENQLGRYAAYLHKNYTEKNHLLLYLTLDGKEASEFSTKYGKVEYLPISYKKEILDWLRRCQKAVSRIPSLKEAIGQYIELIKKLTDQSMNKQNQIDLAKWIVQNNYLEVFLETRSLYEAVKDVVLNNLKDSFTEEFLKDHSNSDFKISMDENKKFGTQNASLFVHHTAWNKRIAIGFEDAEAVKLYIGVKGEAENLNDVLVKECEAIFRKSEWCSEFYFLIPNGWAGWTYLENWQKIPWTVVPDQGLKLLLNVVAELVSNDEFITFMKRA